MLPVLIFVATSACVGVVATTALAQSAKYTATGATSGKPLQLASYASAHKYRTAGQLPILRVVEPSIPGTLAVKVAVLTTNGLAGWPTLRGVSASDLL